jgi:hypothetical protein
MSELPEDDRVAQYAETHDDPYDPQVYYCVAGCGRMWRGEAGWRGERSGRDEFGIHIIDAICPHCYEAAGQASRADR